MKRLLTYLFIVFVLGLTFSVNANSAKYSYDKDFICFQDVGNGTVFVGTSKSGWATEVNNIENLCSIFVYEDKHPKKYKEITDKWPYLLKIKNNYKTPVAEQYLKWWKLRDKKFLEISHGKILLKEKTKIVKNEPSTKKKIVKKSSNDWRKNLAVEGTVSEKEKTLPKKNLNKNLSLNNYAFYAFEYPNSNTLSRIYGTSTYNNSEAILLLENGDCKFGSSLDKLIENTKYETSFDLKCRYHLVNNNIHAKIQDRISISIYPKEMKVRTINSIGKTISRVADKNETLYLAKTYKASKLIAQIGGNESKTLIAENKKTVGSKKKVEIAKVEEPKQEEFTPKKTNQDKDPPVIEVAENITVSDSTYEIKGNVKDKSKKIFIEVGGRTFPVKKGKFIIKRFSPIDEQIKIVAIDQWGNRSKPKTVNIKIEIKNIELAEKLEPLNPRKLKTKTNKNKVALIIGIEKYEQTPAANFANLDAKYFYEYARKAFGISKSNIKLLIDEDANLVKSLGTLNKWLPGKIKSDETELIIFFAGHGLASSDGKELYILPQDSDPDLLTRTALSRTELFKEILSLNPKSVIMFMDTCYSGISRDEKMLLASARPIRIIASNDEGIPDNFTIFSASKLDQISSGLNEASHGIFSYYLMKGLEGKADLNSDRKITNGELLSYLDDNVSQKASELGRQQNPSLTGDPDKVLMSYR